MFIFCIGRRHGRTALAAFKKLAYRDRVFTLMGPSSASLINVLVKSIQKVKLPTISVTFPEVTVKPFKKYVFIVTGIYGGQVRAIVDYMVKDYGLKEPRIGLVYPDTEAGKTDVRAALPRLKKYNIEPVTKVILMAGSLDATSQVMNLKKNKVNCVLNVGTIPASTITLLRGLKKFGLNIPVFSSYGAMGNEELNKIGEAGNQAYSVFPFSTWYGEGPGLEDMRKITLKYYPGTEKPYRGAVYTLGWGMSVVLVEGFRRAGRDLHEDSFIKALESLKNYDTGGLCPPITFSSSSHKGGGSWKIFRADSGSGKFIALTGWKKSD